MTETTRSVPTGRLILGRLRRRALHFLTLVEYHFALEQQLLITFEQFKNVLEMMHKHALSGAIHPHRLLLHFRSYMPYQITRHTFSKTDGSEFEIDFQIEHSFLPEIQYFLAKLSF